MVAHQQLLRIIICYNGTPEQTVVAQGYTGELRLRLLARIGTTTYVYSRPHVEGLIDCLIRLGKRFKFHFGIGRFK